MRNSPCSNTLHQHNIDVLFFSFGCVFVCLSACVRACVRACGRACVRACGRAFMYVGVNSTMFYFGTFDLRGKVFCRSSMKTKLICLHHSVYIY